jgi:hypothetical protein
VTGSNGLLDTVFETYKGTKPVEDTSYADAKAAAEKALADNTAAGQDADKKADAAKALAAAEKDLKNIQPKDLTGEEAAERAELLADLAAAIAKNPLATTLKSNNAQVVVDTDANTVKAPKTMTLQNVKNALSDTEGFGFTFTAVDAYGNPVDLSKAVSAATTITVTLNDQFGEKSETSYTVSGVEYYSVFFTESQVTVKTGTPATAINSGDTVADGTVLTLTLADGYKISTSTPAASTSDGVTTITVDASTVTIATAALTAAEKASEKETTAYNAVANFSLSDITGTTAASVAEDAVKANIKSQIENKIVSDTTLIKDTDFTVTVALADTYTAPASAGKQVTTTTITVTVKGKSGETLSAGNATYNKSATVKVTWLDTAENAKTAVAAAVSATTPYTVSGNSVTSLIEAVKTAIATVPGATNATVTNASSIFSSNGAFVAGTSDTVNYSFDYNGETLTGSVLITLQ